MVPDSYGKLHPRLIREEHVSVTEEPSGRYLWHFVPEDPVPPEKPAFKVAQALYDLLVTYDSTDSLIVLQDGSPQPSRSCTCGPERNGLTGKELNTLEILVKYCLQVYFKLYYDIKVHHRLEDGPKHILTQLRVMRSQPKKVQTAVTFYVRTRAWFAHSECVLLSLMASQSEDDRRFAVTQILKLRASEEYGDTSVRPRITPKLNLSTTSLQTLISWQPGQVHEPAFTCSLSGDQIKEILVKPYEVPEFSIHIQSTERVVKQVTEAAAAVVGQQARERVHPGSGPPPGDHALLFGLRRTLWTRSRPT
ncbi:hypothetical protein GWK47_029690 [Chionoecetes opilio]|uniref:Uncharacterized protein n=1 Tax=Chionoecetes opilio TaxID=41210 RepID=A0A8J4YSA6_CHIOP|nr:hypothetical protein GWK47_029690 [Chionoecetes opilio]